jgi:two-component system phosphate regulon response regulator OmpR
MPADCGNTARQFLIWIIDRDAALRAALQTGLEAHNFAVRGFSATHNFEQRLARERPDLLLLERQLGEEDGLQLCQRIRSGGDDVPIVMLSALNGAADRILGFEAGADDYLGKPFVERELLMRIQVILRRRNAPPAGAPSADIASTQFGTCHLDFATRTLIRDNQEISLTSGEFSLLAALVRNVRRPLTRERLVELARGIHSDTSERSIDVQISRLRKLIEIDAGKPKHIQTVWGYGYVFVPEN